MEHGVYISSRAIEGVNLAIKSLFVIQIKTIHFFLTFNRSNDKIFFYDFIIFIILYIL